MPSERTPSAAGWHYVACLALVATCASGLPLTSPPAAHKYLHTPQQQQQLLSVTAPQPLTYVAASAAVRRAGLRDDDPSAGTLSEEDLLKALGALQALEEESEVLGYLASIRSGSRGRQIRREVASSEAALESLLLEALARRDRELQTRQAEQREREEQEEEQEEEDEEVREVLADQARRMPRDGRLFAPLYDARSRNGELGVGNAEADDGDDDDEEEEEEVVGGGTADDGYGDVEEELQENREARWRSGDIDDNDNDQEQDDEEEEEEGEEGADGDRREAGEARELLQLLEALQGRDTRQSEGDGRAGRRPTAGGQENVRSVTVMNARHRDAKAGDQRPRLLKQQQQQLERQEEEALDQAANLLLHYALQAGENGDAAASRSRGFARPRSPAPGHGERADGRQRARPAARDQAPEEEEDDEEEEEEARRAEGEPTAELENLVKLLLLQEARGDDRDDAGDRDGAEKQPRQRGDGERRGEASGKGVGSASRDGWQDASARGRRGPKEQKRAGPTEERGDAAAGAEEEEEVEDEDEEEQGLNRAAKSRQSAKEEDGGDDARGDAAAEVEKQDNEVLRDLLQYLKLDEEARREEGPSPGAVAGAGRRPDAPRSAVDDDARIVEELSKFVVDDGGGGGDSDGADDVEDTVEVEDLEEEDDDDDEDRRKRVSPSRRRQKGRGPGAEPRLDLEGLLVELLQGAARGNAAGGEATRHAPAPLRFKEKAS